MHSDIAERDRGEPEARAARPFFGCAELYLNIAHPTPSGVG